MFLRRLWRFAVVLFLLGFLSLGFIVQTDYYLMRPGTAEELGEMIRVEGEGREETGQFFMVTVVQQRANFWNLLYSFFNPSIDIYPASRFLAPDISNEEYHEIMKSWMRDSKYLAQIIALRRAGYEVPITSEGVEIVDIIPGRPAEGVLLPGDIIKTIENKEVCIAEEVVQLVQQKGIGTLVQLAVQRNGEDKEFELWTTSHLEEPQKAALMIYVRTLNWQPSLPLEIDIDTGPVLGPSAGLMFVLEILDRVVPENLTSGHTIAGTGTITMDEQVGGIGGVKQKVITAEKAGIEYFLVPQENYQEASQVARDIKVVPVGELEDAISFLQELKLKGKSISYHLITECLKSSPPFLCKAWGYPRV
jgi:PDZ domain-containing protein